MKQKFLIGVFVSFAVVAIGAGSLLLAGPHPNRIAGVPAEAVNSTSEVSPSTSSTAPLHSLGVMTISRALTVEGSFEPISVTIMITDPALIATSVNLFYSPPNTSADTVIGTLNDDGIEGDAVAGDKIYSLEFNPSSLPVGEVDLQVSAAFRGSLKRTKSSIVRLYVSEPQDQSQWTHISDPQNTFTIAIPSAWAIRIAPVSQLDPGTIASYQFMFPDGTVPFVITEYSASQWQSLASSAGIVPVVLASSTTAVFTVSEAQDSVAANCLTDQQIRSQLPTVYSTFQIQ